MPKESGLQQQKWDDWLKQNIGISSSYSRKLRENSLRPYMPRFSTVGLPFIKVYSMRKELKAMFSYSEEIRRETTIDDIEEPDATKYINLLKDKIVIDQFPLKIKIIITSEFATPIAFDRIESHYSHPAKVVLTQNNLSKFYDDLIDKFKAWVDQFQERGSGFDFNSIKSVQHIYILLLKNKQRVTNYKEYEDEISMRGIEYPVAKEDIPKVEKQNNLIINVFILKDQTNKQTLDPIYVSNKESEKCYVVDLLYIENNGNAHYCLIKDLDSFMCDNNGHKQFTCRNCIQGFQREETLEKHKKYVMITNLVEP
ncbi:unnamed protein product [Mytilus coruscus]|uniref:C2H2-type domain-containing protein n=1 Tax=Mytilus coruscus TaxID=42192 RepID=A0A6J8BXI2_MYTCO|nr:unnamed protein product [Mytilus coruscus]